MNDSKSMVVSGNGVSINTLERMSQAIAKSGLFAVKSPEAAFTLLLIADAEGIPPAQAMMDYDVIAGKPALKSAAMLARFQRSGGKVQWVTSTDACVTGKFSHPAGGELTVTWDEARIKTAELSGKDMHKKFPMQMKRARCISEAIRAIAPQCIPLNMYSVEETRDMDAGPEPVSIQEAVTTVAAIMDRDKADAFVDAMSAAKTEHALKLAFQEAWRATLEIDKETRRRFTSVYESNKVALQQKVVQNAELEKEEFPTTGIDVPDRI